MNPSPSVAFDTTALTEPVDKRVVREWGRSADAAALGVLAKKPNWVLMGVGGAIFLLIFVTVAVSVFGPLFSNDPYAEPPSSSAVFGLSVFFVFAIFTGPLMYFQVIRVRDAKWARSYRLNRFARANALSYASTLPAPALPGMIFAEGRGRVATDLLRGSTPRFVEFANYDYTTGSGKHETTHHWGYVAIKLDVPLPHIVLDARGNNGVFGSNLPVSLRGNQRLSLEGDFDQYFSLYCPAGYETDALYLFTPDIMVRFIDHASSLDVEIIDDWLFLYVNGRLVTANPENWAWIFTTVQAIIDKFDQWARWRDSRLATDAAAPALGVAANAAPTPVATQHTGVAEGGRRLKRSFPWTPAISAVVVVVVWLLFSGNFSNGG